MALEHLTITPDDKKKFASLEAAALQTYQQIDDLKEGLKEMVKAVAEEYSVKPVVFTKAFRAVYKNKIADDKEQNADVHEVLHINGHV